MFLGVKSSDMILFGVYLFLIHSEEVNHLGACAAFFFHFPLTDAVLLSLFAGERRLLFEVGVPWTALHVVCVGCPRSRESSTFALRPVRTCLHNVSVGNISCN